MRQHECLRPVTEGFRLEYWLVSEMLEMSLSSNDELGDEVEMHDALDQV